MEIEQGRAYQLNLVTKRLWYAPWKTKTIGIKFNRFFISLKQPKPALFDVAHRKCGLSIHGKTCSLGDSFAWSSLYEDKDIIDKYLIENGGDKLPEQVMTNDAEHYSSDGRCRDIFTAHRENKMFNYRPVCRLS